MSAPIDHKKGLAAVIGMLVVLSAFILGPRLLAASMADPTWLIVIAIIAGACALWRKQLVSFVRWMQRPTD